MGGRRGVWVGQEGGRELRIDSEAVRVAYRRSAYHAVLLEDIHMLLLRIYYHRDLIGCL
jgi:hypothetical protein